MALLDGKQLRDQSTSLDKLRGYSGLVTFTASATMSFAAGSVLRQADENIIIGTDVVNKNYVDSVAQGLNIKESVHVIATTAITLSGTQSIDSHLVEVGERVLVNGQAGLAATSSNGIYVVSAGAWSRAADADGTPLISEVQVGDFVFIGHGALYAGTGWVLNVTDSTDLDILVGTESQHWTQFSSAGVITAGDGLGQNGVDIFINTGTGLTVSLDTLVIADIVGLTSGSYGTTNSVPVFNVNNQGQVTTAQNQLINIASTQVFDFASASEAQIFQSGNFVDGSTVDFTVTGGESVSAEVTLGSLTASRLNIINPGSASQDWKLGYNSSGQFEWFDPSQGDISEVVAGNGLTGGGIAGVVTLDVNTTNGLTVSGDFVQIADTAAGSGLTFASGVFNINTTAGVTILNDSVQIADTAAGSGLTFSAGVFDINTTGGITVLNDSVQIADTAAGSGLTFSAGVFNVNTTAGITVLNDSVQIADTAAGSGLTFSAGVFNVNVGGGVTILNDTVQIVDTLAGTGLTYSGGVINVNLGINSGLTFSGDDIIIPSTIAGNGIDFTNGVLSVTTSQITSALAGNGLTANGSTLDVNVNADSLEIINDVIRLKDTITGNRTFQDTLTVGGNLQVNGTVSYINTENLYVEDNIITLNATFSGVPFLNAGIEVNRGIDTTSTLIWNEATDLWSAGLSGSEVAILLNAGTGLSKNGATVSLDYVTVTGTGLTQNGTNIAINFNAVTGTGLTQNGSQISIDTTGFASALAGEGLSANGGTLSVNVGNGLEIVSDTVYLGGTLSQATKIEAATNDFTVQNIGSLTFTASTAADIKVESIVPGAINKLSITGATSRLEAGDGTTYSTIRATYNDASLNSESGGTTNSIRVANAPQTLGGADGSTGNYLLVKDNFANKGLVYEGDYTANFTTFSLVTKAYVDAAVSGVGADNGLQEVSPGVVGLGGTLSQNTTINGAVYDFTIQNFDTLTLTGSVVDVQLDNGLFLIDAGVSGSIDLYGGDVTIFATGSVDITSTTDFTVTTGTGSITTSNLQGLVYTADYSATFVNNSLVTKFYVDNAVNALNNDAILGVTAGAGISGGGTSGNISLAIELSAASGLTFSGAGDSGTLQASVDGTTIQVNGAGQLTVVAGASQPVYDETTAVATSGNFAAVTGSTLSATPNDYSRIQLFINGQQQRIGNGVKTGVDCYFSSDGGTTAKSLANLASGDQLYWNGVVAGFDLSGTDKVDIVYEA